MIIRRGWYGLVIVCGIIGFGFTGVFGEKSQGFGNVMHEMGERVFDNFSKSLKPQSQEGRNNMNHGSEMGDRKMMEGKNGSETSRVYYFKNIGSGEYLASFNENDLGTRVKPMDGDLSEFKFEYDKTFQFLSSVKYPTKVVDRNLGDKKNMIYLHTIWNGTNQIFIYRQDTKQLFNPETKNVIVKEGDKLWLKPSSGGENEKWEMVSAEVPIDWGNFVKFPVSGVKYYIQNIKKKQYLTFKDGMFLTVRDRSTLDSKSFEWVLDGNLQRIFNPITNKVIDRDGFGENTDRMILNSYDNNPGQALIYDSRDMTLINPISGSVLAMGKQGYVKTRPKRNNSCEKWGFVEVEEDCHIDGSGEMRQTESEGGNHQIDRSGEMKHIEVEGNYQIEKPIQMKQIEIGFNGILPKPLTKYYFINAKTSKYLTFDDKTYMSYMSTAPLSIGDTSKFEWEFDESLKYISNPNFPGKVLDRVWDKVWGEENLNSISLYPFHGGENQIFKYNPVNGNIFNPQTGKVLIPGRNSRVRAVEARGRICERWNVVAVSPPQSSFNVGYSENYECSQ